MLHARLMEPLSLALLDESKLVFGASRLQDMLDTCVQDGLLDCVEADVSKGLKTYRPTEKGWLLGNELYGRLWDLRL